MLNKKLLALAVTLSLLAAGSVYWYLSTMVNRMDTSDTVSAVVAAVDIPRNTVIQEEMLTKTELPRQYFQAGGVTATEEAVGKVSNTKIFGGQQLLSQALITSGDKSAGLTHTVPKGKRAVTIAIDQVSGLDGQLMPGDRVDVAATMGLAGAQGGTQVSIILQNIQVLAIGRALEADAQTWAQREATETTATLAVTPQEAESLIMAADRGAIRMLLRSPADENEEQVPSLHLNDMLQKR